MFDWSESVLDIREEIPLIHEDNIAIAQQERIKHSAVRGVEQVTTSDFLDNTNAPFQKQFVVQVKYCD